MYMGGIFQREKFEEYSDVLIKLVLVIGSEAFDTTKGIEKGPYKTVFKANSKL